MKTKVIQNLIIFILLAQIANVDCDLKAKATRRKNDPPNVAKNIQGWGGSPDLVREGKDPTQSSTKEYFYLQSNGKASKKAIEQNSESMMITTCTDAASLSGSYDILSTFMDAHIQERSGSDDSGIVTLRIDDAKTYTCKYNESEDKKLKTKECTGTIQNRGTALCWSTTESGLWETCSCLTYIRFVGGRDAVLKKLEFSE